MQNWKEEIISTVQDPRGFEIRVVRSQCDEMPPTDLEQAYTLEGHCIGDVRTALTLYNRGIKPELAFPNSEICTIGWCDREQKYYGWSHRAIYGFGIGDIVQEGDCTASSGWDDGYLNLYPEADLSLPVGFRAETIQDCRRMAIAFADSVA